MGGAVRKIPHGLVPCHLVRVVGAALRQHLRITTWTTHARLRLLRLRLYNTDDRSLAAISLVLLRAKYGNASLPRHSLCGIAR